MQLFIEKWSSVCGFHSSRCSCCPRTDVCYSQHLCQVFVQCLQKALLVLLHQGHEFGQLSSSKLLWDGDPWPERGPQPVHDLLVGVHAFTCDTLNVNYTCSFPVSPRIAAARLLNCSGLKWWLHILYFLEMPEYQIYQMHLCPSGEQSWFRERKISRLWR